MSNTGGTTPQNPQAACDELRDLLPAFALGATTPEESARVRELLPICPDAGKELAEYAALSDALLESSAPAAPPPRLKANLMARLAEREGGTAAVPPMAAPTPPEPRQAAPQLVKTPPARRLPVGWGLAAAAALLLIATNLYWFTQINGIRGELDTSREQLTRVMNRQDRALNLMSDLNTQRIGLQSTEDNLIPLATIYWDPETNEVALVTDQLPALGEDQTYQLWLIDGGVPQSAGIFEPDATGWSWLGFQPGNALTAYQALGISVEPAGGSEQPTTDPLAVGRVST